MCYKGMVRSHKQHTMAIRVWDHAWCHAHAHVTCVMRHLRHTRATGWRASTANHLREATWFIQVLKVGVRGALVPSPHHHRIAPSTLPHLSAPRKSAGLISPHLTPRAPPHPHHSCMPLHIIFSVHNTPYKAPTCISLTQAMASCMHHELTPGRWLRYHVYRSPGRYASSPLSPPSQQTSSCLIMVSFSPSTLMLFTMPL